MIIWLCLGCIQTTKVYMTTWQLHMHLEHHCACSQCWTAASGSAATHPSPAACHMSTRQNTTALRTSGLGWWKAANSPGSSWLGPTDMSSLEVILGATSCSSCNAWSVQRAEGRAMLTYAANTVAWQQGINYGSVIVEHQAVMGLC